MIELVIVIVIIGILAAAALPRFANLSAQAQTASNQGIAEQFRAAVGITHEAWIAAGSPNAHLSTSIILTLENTGISIGNTGWPDGGSNGAITPATCAAAFNAILSNPPQISTSGCTDTPCYIASQNYNHIVPGPTWFCVYTLYAGATAVSPAHYITYNMGTVVVEDY